MLRLLRMEPQNSGVRSADTRSDDATGAGSRVSPIPAQNVVLEDPEWEAWH